MSTRVIEYGLQIESSLHSFVTNEVIPGTEINQDQFWSSLREIIEDFAPRNKHLLDERNRLQKELGRWHHSNPGPIADFKKYKDFLIEIGYLIPEGPDFQIETENIDTEISSTPAPQLVVPITNARYSLNATNARWGSLYDALYGTDVISEDDDAQRGTTYNPIRGKLVIAWARNFLDKYFPLNSASHCSASNYVIEDSLLKVELADGSVTELVNSNLLKGYSGAKESPSAILLHHHSLHVEIQIDRTDSVGLQDGAGIKDILIESAVTTIQDCEDSVACVDSEDKIVAYRNWLGLMKGDLQESFTKDGQIVHRSLNSNRQYYTPDGEDFSLRGRSLLFIRNVGHLMTSDAILDAKGNEIPEGIMDTMFTATIALHDLKKPSEVRNSANGNVYIVKPKMHGPAESTFTCDLFSRVELALNLPANTLKVGIMDEERRTTINLKECIRPAKKRIVFINTGFLDRTGDEIHTTMNAGSVMAKNKIKSAIWIQGYENWNVDIGLNCGFKGRAQIGKGMWPAPDLMNEMLLQKRQHLSSGASTSWVPSPTAATLHAIHYHEVDVLNVQEEILSRPRASLESILSPSIENLRNLKNEELQLELENNTQGILGYVVKWINQGIGCSKVPDINNIGLMEDRATLRISSQHLCNWLHHGICSKDQVMHSLKKMARVVDNQNVHDKEYIPMSDDIDRSIAFKTACELIFNGLESPNGYTEPTLHMQRKKFKRSREN